MEFKGTKGEWIIDKYKQIISNGDSVLFTGVSVPMTPTEESQCNAKLIAASKDLLEALQNLIDPLTGLVVDFVAHDIGKEKAYQIEKAIEKALK